MSLIATAVKHLLAAGVTGDALVAAIAEMEACAPASPVDASAARRREKDAAYQAAKRADRKAASANRQTSADSADDADAIPPNDIYSNPPTSPVSSKPPRKRAQTALAFVPPSDVPEPEWEAFEEMRRRIGKPMTGKARDLAIERLRKLADDGWPPGEVLNHSTLNNYQGLFPPKDERNGTRGNGRMGGNGGSRSGHGKTVDAAQRVLARRGHPGPDAFQ